MNLSALTTPKGLAVVLVAVGLFAVLEFAAPSITSKEKTIVVTGKREQRVGGEDRYIIQAGSDEYELSSDSSLLGSSALGAYESMEEGRTYKCRVNGWKFTLTLSGKRDTIRDCKPVATVPTAGAPVN